MLGVRFGKTARMITQVENLAYLTALAVYRSLAEKELYNIHWLYNAYGKGTIHC
ncbi:hypothetical protein DIZ76_012743 [Coccidioides immitis]|nr:hypothetical protein DIZ76_012743 [Coccidioides immitis]